ncbi:MAG: hypothetical protein WCO34_13740 [Betaproteobacteria bacterium]|jgi:hypothetical protein
MLHPPCQPSQNDAVAFEQAISDQISSKSTARQNPKIVCRIAVCTAANGALSGALSFKNNFTMVTPRFRSYDDLHQAFLAALKAEEKTVIQAFGHPGFLGGDVAHISIVRPAVKRCVSMYNYKKFGPRPLHKRLEEIAKT